MAPFHFGRRLDNSTNFPTESFFMFFRVFVDLLIALSTGERAHFRAQTKEKSNVIFV